MPARTALWCRLAWLVLTTIQPGVDARAASDHVPGITWDRRSPPEAGMDSTALEAFSAYVGGRGVVVRDGFLVHTWGDPALAGDVASAVKPLFTHFLFQAVREGRVPSLDEAVVRWEPRLATLNADLGFKDRGITWRHLVTQTSCYGLAERPGTAFAYNDWQMALFVDLLFNRVHATPWTEVDARLVRPFLEGTLGCEDKPSLTTFGGGRNPGRLMISPRDFARFGLLYLREGGWGNRVVVPAQDVQLATRSPLPRSLPRAGTNAAPMLPDQRTLGSRRIPDNQTEHFGSYSFLWWVNGLQADGTRHWPDAPADLFAALGHGGIRGVAAFPGLDLVVSWNDGRMDSPARENEAFRKLLRAAPLPAR